MKSRAYTYPCPYLHATFQNIDLSKRRKLRMLSYAIIAYMLLAFTWWAILLRTKNQDAFRARTDLMRYELSRGGNVMNAEEFSSTREYLQLKQDYRVQEYMIISEGVVIFLGIVVGLIMINRGYSELVKGERAKRNFLLSISHELKSPIASIRLALETMQNRKLNEESRTMVSGQALEETDRLHGLVNNLLLAAKMETGYQPNRDNHDVVEIANQLIRAQERLHPKATISLKSTDVPELLEIDKTTYQSVLANLIENAIKYSSNDPMVEISIHFNKDELNIAVSDQGIGIDEEEKEKIFDKFYRIGDEARRKTKGTGLGLYIVNKMVAANEGSIQVMDNQPSGTIFKVMLPAENKS